MELIKFDNVSFSYKAVDDSDNAFDIPVLKNFNLSIEEGSFVAILGHNGSGKSTVAKLTNGILFADEGTVTVNGKVAVDDDSIYEIRRDAGMVFQNPDNQIVASSGEEDVGVGVENLGVPSQECRKRVDEALKTVGMYDYRLKTPSKLSGGQKQRVAVAGIIAMKPRCIILDEPTAMLDPIGRKEVIDTVIKLNKQEGITVVLITHYMDEAVKADRVVVMEKGRIMLDGTPSEVFSNVDKMKQYSLEVPQSTELIDSLGLDLEKTVLNSDECANALYDILKRDK